MMQIVLYTFVAFLFFKIFPEFADLKSNTVTGALIMALVSGAMMQAAEFAAAWRIGLWMQTPRQDSLDQPSGLLLIPPLALAASVGSTWLIGTGFSAKLMQDAFGRYSSDPTMFWAMAALPPLVHLALRGPVIWRAVQLVREARRQDGLTPD